MSDSLSITATGSWTLSCSPWLAVTPKSGSGSASVKVSITDQSYLPSTDSLGRPCYGTFYGFVTITYSDGSSDLVEVSYQVGYGDGLQTPAPFGGDFLLEDMTQDILLENNQPILVEPTQQQ